MNRLQLLKRITLYNGCFQVARMHWALYFGSLQLVNFGAFRNKVVYWTIPKTSNNSWHFEWSSVKGYNDIFEVFIHDAPKTRLFVIMFSRVSLGNLQLYETSQRSRRAEGS